MYTVILITQADSRSLKALLEANLDDQTSVVVSPSIATIFPDILRSDPLLALISASALQEQDLGVIQVLKKTFPHLRIILTCRPEQRDLAARALEHGADSLFFEPFFINEFSILLKKEYEKAFRQQEFLQALRLETLSSFVEGLAPEINNPLTTIRGFLQILQTQNTYKVSAQEINEIYCLLEKESRRISQVITDLELFSGSRKPHKGLIEIEALIKQVVNEMKADFEEDVGTEISMTTDFVECPSRVMADRNMCLAALKGLLGFLLAGVEEGKGMIYVKTARSPRPNYITIIIEGVNTTSIGQDVDRVFIPLFSRKIISFKEEISLGAAYGIIRAHGGKINAVPLRKGTRFSIELPSDLPPPATFSEQSSDPALPDSEPTRLPPSLPKQPLP